MNRLLRVSIPGGAIELERRLGPGSVQRDVDRPAFLDVASGPLLATTPDGTTVLALIRTVSGRDSLAVIDPQSLETRCRHLLEYGVRYSGLLVDRSGMFYSPPFA